MAKRKTPVASTSAPIAAIPTAPVTPIIWGIPVGLTVLTTDPVDVTTAPSAEQRAAQHYRYTTEILPRILEVLRKAGLNVVDDIECDNALPCWPTGAIAKVVYPPKAKPVKVASVSADGAHNDDVGLLAEPPVPPANVEHPADKKPRTKRKH